MRPPTARPPPARRRGPAAVVDRAVEAGKSARQRQHRGETVLTDRPGHPTADGEDRDALVEDHRVDELSVLAGNTPLHEPVHHAGPDQTVSQ